jgi:anti-anti-sigma factor
MTHGPLPEFRMAIDYEQQGRTSVQLLGELDIASLSRLSRVLHALLDDRGRLAVDLHGLRFVDVPGARLLMELTGVAAGRNCSLQIAGATGQVARVLELTSARFLPPMAAAA